MIANVSYEGIDGEKMLRWLPEGNGKETTRKFALPQNATDVERSACHVRPGSLAQLLWHKRSRHAASSGCERNWRATLTLAFLGLLQRLN